MDRLQPNSASQGRGKGPIRHHCMGAKVGHIYLFGGYNARVGADRESRPNVLRHHGVCRVNENDLRLLELCCYHRLYVKNTIILPETVMSQSLLETSKVKALASDGHDHHQA